MNVVKILQQIFSKMEVNCHSYIQQLMPNILVLLSFLTDDINDGKNQKSSTNIISQQIYVVQSAIAILGQKQNIGASAGQPKSRRMQRKCTFSTMS